MNSANEGEGGALIGLRNEFDINSHNAPKALERDIISMGAGDFMSEGKFPTVNGNFECAGFNNNDYSD